MYVFLFRYGIGWDFPNALGEVIDGNLVISVLCAYGLFLLLYEPDRISLCF
jgi:hypothetical protein